MGPRRAARRHDRHRQRASPAGTKASSARPSARRCCSSSRPTRATGTTGSSDGTIKGTDTLVFVVDILDAYCIRTTPNGVPASKRRRADRATLTAGFGVASDPGGTNNGTVHAAAMSFDLHVPESRSLKAKRAAIRPIVDGLRHRFRISVAEVGHQDQWQRAEIAVAIVAESDGRVQHAARRRRAVRGRRARRRAARHRDRAGSRRTRDAVSEPAAPLPAHGPGERGRARGARRRARAAERPAPRPGHRSPAST